MSLAIQKADFFKQDYAIRFAWYVDEAGAEVARRFHASVSSHFVKLIAIFARSTPSRLDPFVQLPTASRSAIHFKDCQQ